MLFTQAISHQCVQGAEDTVADGIERADASAIFAMDRSGRFGSVR